MSFSEKPTAGVLVCLVRVCQSLGSAPAHGGGQGSGEVVFSGVVGLGAEEAWLRKRGLLCTPKAPRQKF